MNLVKVPGRNNRHAVRMYAISTCPWCKRAKQFLKDHSIGYEYVDIDLATPEDQETIRRDILRRGGQLIYPTIIINDTLVINHFNVVALRKALEIE
ncbi:MAG: glutaredoxin [Candidatus Bathyarchaeota archaeon]|nr:MAG: glutaredoxin [Candidatus Bathyarchaeota archaeon]